MPFVSICINADTRVPKDSADGLFNGVVNEDFLIDGVLNKIKFFEGFEKEVIVFIDEHSRVPISVIDKLHSITDTLVIRKHTHEEKFNDWTYVSTLALCRGEYIAHWDQDMAAFTSSPEPINDMLKLLESFDYVSYPSHWSPKPVDDPNYDYSWCSTRFFMCKRETLDITEIKKCLVDFDYLYSRYPASVRNPWTEHILGLTAKYKGRGVFYPKINLDTHAIFAWNSYRAGILKLLNNMEYPPVKRFIEEHGGIHYPADLTI